MEAQMADNKCGAKSRRTGLPCNNYPMPNGRCRMHGGKS
ncbi:HGGxSTG domain-containing protein, partial [Bacillus cereus]